MVQTRSQQQSKDTIPPPIKRPLTVPRSPPLLTSRRREKENHALPTSEHPPHNKRATARPSLEKILSQARIEEEQELTFLCERLVTSRIGRVAILKTISMEQTKQSIFLRFFVVESFELLRGHTGATLHWTEKEIDELRLLTMNQKKNPKTAVSYPHLTSEECHDAILQARSFCPTDLLSFYEGKHSVNTNYLMILMALHPLKFVMAVLSCQSPDALYPIAAEVAKVLPDEPLTWLLVSHYHRLTDSFIEARRFLRRCLHAGREFLTQSCFLNSPLDRLLGWAFSLACCRADDHDQAATTLSLLAQSTSDADEKDFYQMHLVREQLHLRRPQEAALLLGSCRTSMFAGLRLELRAECYLNGTNSSGKNISAEDFLLKNSAHLPLEHRTAMAIFCNRNEFLANCTQSHIEEVCRRYRLPLPISTSTAIVDEETAMDLDTD